MTSPSVKHIPVPPPPWGDNSTDIAPTPMEALAGEFAIATNAKGFFLTAVNGGGKTTDVIHTDAQLPRAWETFNFWVDSATRQFFAFQTVNGQFITANNAGGLTTNTILTTTTREVRGWEMFKLLPPQSNFTTFAIQTFRGFLLTAVGGGGHDSGDTIHTDAVNADKWEQFRIFRRGDFGTSTYGIEEAGAKQAVETGPFLGAVNGGGLAQGPVLISNTAVPFWISWTLLKQDDGTFAFQTASGNVLTANGGGIPGAGWRTDKVPSQIGDWEKFTLVDDGFFTVLIKTSAGTFLALPDAGNTVTTVTDSNQARRWRFWVFNLRS